MKLTALVITILFFAGCAGQRPPEGGPLDTVPPEIISVYPAPNTTHFTDNHIALEFSEYVDRRSVQDAIFISPNIADVEYDWSGTEVELTFKEQLHNGTTYVINVGTDVIDINNRNRMAKAFSFAFSTGEKIDINSLQGKVIDDKPAGIMIFSYKLNGINPDTLNPAMTKPDFITQTGNSGEFTLSNLADGTYRLFAIRDEYKNLLYDPETDAAGTLTEDVTVNANDTMKTGLQFMIAKEDTTPPRLSNILVPDNRHLIVQFTEQIDTAVLSPSMFSITDTIGRKALLVQSVIPQHDRMNAMLVTSTQKKDSQYVLQVNKIQDNSGHTINPIAKQKSFIGSARADTLPPEIVFTSLRDSASLVTQDEPLIFEFSDAVSSPVSGNAIHFMRTKDSAAISFDQLWKNAAVLFVQPRNLLQPNEHYRLTLSLKYFTDLSSNANNDTTAAFAFQTVDPEQYGSIEGKCIAKGFTQNIIIETKNITRTETKPRTTELKSDGFFSFPLLPEGKYVLKAFVDSDKNKLISTGKIFPYQRSEKFLLYPDTVKVRARWPVDGVIFR